MYKDILIKLKILTVSSKEEMISLSIFDSFSSELTRSLRFEFSFRTSERPYKYNKIKANPCKKLICINKRDILTEILH